MTHDGFHLPGLRAEDVAAWRTREYADGHSIRFPELKPGALGRIAAGLVETRRQALAVRGTSAIVDAIDRAAARLADPSDSLRQTADAALPAITGYSSPMLGFGLDRMIQDWRRPALEAVLTSELPHPDALDRFVARAGGGSTRGFGPELALHVFSGNVPGVAVTSLVRSLLVRAATLGKTASGEPLLPVLFARALAQVDARLADCLAVTYWPGGEAIEDEAFQLADAVVVYGGREAVANARQRAPAHTRVIEHGPRLSFGIIGAGALTDEATAGAAAAEAATAVAMFDQQGCVSPHLFYVEATGNIAPGLFADLLARQLDRIERTLPRGRLSPAEAAAIQSVRAAAEFRAIAGQGVVLRTGPGTTWTVILEPDPDFSTSCLNRLVRVKPVADLADVPRLVAPLRNVLQTVAVAGAGARLHRLATALADAGGTRITTLAAMPWPPPAWHHDGRGPLRELLRWVDIEDDAAGKPGSGGS